MKASKDTMRMKRIGYATGGEGASVGVSSKAELSINYLGAPFGASSGFLATAVSALGPSLLAKGKFDNAYIFLTAAEVQLNLAEAKERFGTGVNLTGTAKSYFEAGIAQSFRTLGTPMAGAAGFIGSKIDNYDYEASTNKLNAIAIQKWLAFTNFSGLEAWSEYRKTGLPAHPQSVQVTDARRPVRFYYPNTESGANAANVTAQGTIDVFATKLFWDVD